MNENKISKHNLMANFVPDFIKHNFGIVATNENKNSKKEIFTRDIYALSNITIITT